MSASNAPRGSSPRRGWAPWLALAGGAALLIGGGWSLRSRGFARPPSPSSSAPRASAGPSIAGCPDDMVAIPAGPFRMGSPEGEGRADEHPEHPVTLSAYCLDRAEVTVAAYRACVDAARGGPGCKPPGAGAYCNGAQRERDDHPINCVDWNDAEAYCAFVGKRLPTEAEWERAARGGDPLRAYPWGNEPPARQLCWDGEGNARGLGKREGTCPVGSVAPAIAGLVDLGGNVTEWVADTYAPYRAEPAIDPRATDTPLQHGRRVVRGGSWFSDDPGQVRAARRDWYMVTDRAMDIGVRCARSQGG